MMNAHQQPAVLAVQVLKCISSVTSKPAVSLSDAQDNIQLFPFGSEYASAPSRVPPLRQKGGYDQKADIWAVGCLLFELLTGMRQTSQSSYGKKLSKLFLQPTLFCRSNGFV